MRNAAIFLIIVTIITFVVVARIRGKKARAKASPEVYTGLRSLALNTSRAEFGFPATSKSTEPWGVIMDWGANDWTATVVAFSDGNASVYLSNGGGFIGGSQSHETIRNAAKKMLAAAIECQHLASATESFPLPQRDGVIFYFRTDDGVFTASASATELAAGRHPLSKLGSAAQDVITQYRLIRPEPQK